MIEATCAACGNVTRLAEADVPAGQKFVTCESCNSRVALPPQASAMKPGVRSVAIPAIPTKLPTPGKGVPAPPPRRATPPKGVPAPASKPEIDLADLPAPKRGIALGAEASKPAPRSALDAAELPVPKHGPRALAPQSSVDLDDLMPKGLADLPAPKAKGLADLPAPKSKAITDLPAPKTRSDADLPAPKTRSDVDLPTPKTRSDADLPAPKTRSDVDLPAPKARSDADLAAKGRTDAPAADLGAANSSADDSSADDGWDDDFELPMASAGPTDLPAARVTPKPFPAQAAPRPDLPAPKGFFDDLPQPAKPSSQAQDIAPKGFFDDLPQPARKGGGIDLPAPKGFFDDLPQPAKASSQAQDIAPKGFFDDLPQPAKKGGADLPAPKGFFDDLPQPAKASSQANEVAPKGFFDDLPQPAKGGHDDVTQKQQAGQGFFDDLPQPNKATLDDVTQKRDKKGFFDDISAPQPKGLFDDVPEPAGQGLFDDIAAPEPSSASSDFSLDGGDIDLGPVTGSNLELDMTRPDLDLGISDSEQFRDLDLSEPSKPAAKPESPIKIKTPSGAPLTPIQISVKPTADDVQLDLEDQPRTAAAAAATAKLAPKKKPEAKPAKPKKRRTMLLAGVLGLIGLTGGGLYAYKRYTDQQARAATVKEKIAQAQQAMRGPDPNHWQRAGAAANAALEIEATNPHALGLAAEAAIAGALDTGVNGNARIAQGRNFIQRALEASKSGPELERAQAVAAIAAKGQQDRAIQLVGALASRAPQDGWLQLYLGWAQLAKGDEPEAIKAFEAAIAKTPATKIPALYGEGRAKLLLADLPGAKASFVAVLEASKDHICAQVGLAATHPPSESTQREAELHALLERKDIKSADPRCVVQAHSMIGDIARSADRRDDARQNYRDALQLAPNDVASLTGLAAVELRDGKLSIAGDLLQKASAVSADDIDVQLVTAELWVRQGRLPDADKTLASLAARKPPLPTLAQARLQIVNGRLLEAQGNDDGAADAFTEAAKIAGDVDLSLTLTAATQLSELAKKAKDPAKASQYRARADQLLAPLDERAREDADLSLALGTAYLQAGDAAKAENFLRRSVEMRGENPEARLQYAKALRALNKLDEAIVQLKEGLKLDPKRTDISLELAATYQSAGRDADAIATYDQLLALPDVPNVVRVNAGRYYAKKGLIDKAAAQSELILKTEPDNPGGLYLKAEGLMKAGHWPEARAALVKATEAEPDNAQYLDALGRALEGSLEAEKDTKYIEAARSAYERASKADPKMFHPLLGQGHMLVLRRDFEQALVPLIGANALDKSNGDVLYWGGLAYFGLRTSSPKYMTASAQWLESAFKTQLPDDKRADSAWKLGQLYNDLNRAGEAARAYENATTIGEEIEKKTGTAPEWLTETWYDLGDLYSKLNNPKQQKRAWERYVHRNPKRGVRWDTANNALATSLQRY